MFKFVFIGDYPFGVNGMQTEGIGERVGGGGGGSTGMKAPTVFTIASL